MIRGDKVRDFVKSPNFSGEFTRGVLDTIIIHYTAGPYQSAVNTLINPAAKASAHMIIDRDGSITQLIPLNFIAWHAGPSSYNGRTGFNRLSIGIEIVNAGMLTKSGNVYRSWFGSAYNPNEVIEAIHRNEKTPRFWHIYTEEQIDATIDICRVLIETYNLKHILGHEEICKGMKFDPGPAFPLDRMRNQLLGNGRNQDDDATELPSFGRVTASSLNVRSSADVNAEKVSKPLTKGAKVKILDQANGWYKVIVEVEGWVLGQYVENAT